MDKALIALLRLFFRLLYHEFAWSYDFVAAGVSLGEWRQWVLSALRYLPGPRVLELGFGPGHLQVALYEAGLRPFGMDASAQMVAIAARRLRSHGLTPRLVYGLAQRMPFSDTAFDQIAATFPSDYIYSPQTLSEIHRVLAPGGRLVVIPAAWITGASPQHRFLAGVFRITHQSPPRPSPQSLDRVKVPFKKAGFEVETQLLSYPTSEIIILNCKKPEK